jgi:hypothetical protein
MIDDAVLALLQKVAEGTATQAESASLHEILRRNEEARSAFDDLQVVMRTLGSVREASVPPTLKPAVMRALGTRPLPSRVTRLRGSILTLLPLPLHPVKLRQTIQSAWCTLISKPIPTSTNRAEAIMKGNKRIVIGGAVVALCAVVYFSFFYPPTSPDETQGAIGAAKKYRSEQITDKDVQLAAENNAAGTTGTGVVDEQAAADLQKNATELSKTIKVINATVTLDKTMRATYNNAAAALEATAKFLADKPWSGHRGVTWDNRAMADMAAQASTLDKAIKSALEKTKSIDRTAALKDMAKTAASLEKNARQFEKTSRSTLEMRESVDR